MARAFDLKSYARRGAEVRLSEMREEMSAIYATFPDLRRGKRPNIAATNSSESEPDGPRRRRRRRMSAAQRRAVSARMKKYWANRRAAKK